MYQSLHSQSQQGFTLVEMLVAVALMALLFITLTTLIARGAQASRSSTLAATTNVSLTKVSEQLGQDIGTGLNILTQASNTQLSFLRLGRKIPLYLTPDEATTSKFTLHFQGNPLGNLVGQNIIVIDAQGDYITTRVAASNNSSNTSQVTFSCLMTMPAPLTAYPYSAVSFYATDQGLARTQDGQTTLLASNITKTVFEPLYGSAGAGTFGPTLSVPTFHQNGQILSMVDYALTATGEHPLSAPGSSRLNLAAIHDWGCSTNPTAPANNLGKLQVNVLYNNRPLPPIAGALPNVGVNGPSTAKGINRWVYQVYENMPAGSYSANAFSIVNGSTIYDPTVTGSPTIIGNGHQATINVNYITRRGTINVVVNGLPSPPPASGMVRFSGPENQAIPALNSTSVLKLTPGTYSITADTIGSYIPHINTTSLTVGSSTNTTITVTYSIPTGPLALTVQGLPASTSAPLGISGPQSQTVNVQNGTTQTVNLQTGTYTIDAPNVTVNGTAYTPDKPSITMNLTTEGSSQTITYVAQTITGGGPGTISVGGPGTITGGGPVSRDTKVYIHTGSAPASNDQVYYELDKYFNSNLTSQQLNYDQTYELDSNASYLIKLVAVSTSDGGCDDDHSCHGGTGSGHGHSWTRSDSTWQTDHAEEAKNIQTILNINGNSFIQLKPGTLTNYNTLYCPNGSNSCTVFNPIVVSDTDQKTVMAAAEIALKTLWQQNFANKGIVGNSIIIKDYYSASGLTSSQQIMWNSLIATYLPNTSTVGTTFKINCDPIKIAGCQSIQFNF